MSPRKLITAAQVAEILGYGSTAYFKRIHRSLEAKGFPKPFRSYPLMWDPGAIAAYQDARIPPSTTVAIDSSWEDRLSIRLREQPAT
jgi:predicted DNA-binding transcriptional regulator AlpA